MPKFAFAHYTLFFSLLHVVASNRIKGMRRWKVLILVYLFIFTKALRRGLASQKQDLGHEMSPEMLRTGKLPAEGEKGCPA